VTIRSGSRRDKKAESRDDNERNQKTNSFARTVYQTGIALFLALLAVDRFSARVRYGTSSLMANIYVHRVRGSAAIAEFAR